MTTKSLDLFALLCQKVRLERVAHHCVCGSVTAIGGLPSVCDVRTEEKRREGGQNVPQLCGQGVYRFLRAGCVARRSSLRASGKKPRDGVGGVFEF